MCVKHEYFIINFLKNLQSCYPYIIDGSFRRLIEIAFY